MTSSRRRILPHALLRIAAAGALAVTACDNQTASANEDLQSEADNKASSPPFQEIVLNQTGGDPERGEAIYIAKCGGCHSVDQNRIGPKHRGVVGRRAGGVEDYSYSPALQSTGIVWDAASLDEWLKGPTKMVPGTRMGLALSDMSERQDVIAYLTSISE